MDPILRYIIKVITIVVLSPLKLFPINRKKILLLNDIAGNSPNYAGNIKYILEDILKNHMDEFEIILPLGKKEQHCKLRFPNNVKVITLNSIIYFYHALTCSVFITTNGGISYIPFKKKQIVINTWHGGGAYKKMGLDVSDNKSLIKAIKIAEQKTDYFVSSNAYFSKVINSAFLIPQEKVLNFGLPRNDILFDTKNHSRIKDKVKKEFKVPIEHRVVLYTPTFRTLDGNIFGKHLLGPYDLDFDKVIESFENRFGGKWLFAIRLHPSLVKAKIDLPGNIINMSYYDDPQELFIAVDAMINDYSSTMWDFSLTNKPCFIYANDLNKYNLDLGFYTKPNEWPFPLATNNDELVKNINNFNFDIYRENLSHYFKWMESYETGKATKQLINFILEKVKK